MKYPNFFFEKKLWKRGFKIVGGVDEVGRGSFAGPVVAGCVVFNNNLTMKQFGGFGININDSKKLTVRQRNIADDWIKDNALTWGIGKASVAEINRLGVGMATLSAFRRAVTDANKRLHSRIQYLLIDAFYIPYMRGIRSARIKYRSKKNRALAIEDLKARQLAIIHGDEKSISIGAASIIAKVYRDKLMVSLSNDSMYKKYGWEKNKGYGTKDHRNAIKKYGVTREHRNRFVETFLKNLLN